MFRNGSIVTLLVDKEHGTGEHALRVNSGVIGMVVNCATGSDGSSRYVVDFGPLGQWNCTHSELRAERPGDDLPEPPTYAPSEFASISIRPDDNDDDDELLDNDDEEEDDDDDGERTAAMTFGAVDSTPPRVATFRSEENEIPEKVLSFEEALEKKMKELEKQGR